MLLRYLITFLSLWLAAASKSPRELFTSLAAANNGVIKLDDEIYNLITSPTRNWSVVIQLTALESFKCAPCMALDPAYKTIGKTWWTKVPANVRDDHFFATLDYMHGKETFKKLNINSAPIVHVHPPAQGPRRPINGKTEPLTLGFEESGFDAGSIAEALSRHTPVPIPYRPPPNYGLIVTIILTLLAFAVLARFILPILMSRWTWALITIGTSLVMVGGFMFVRIRGTPYVAAGQTGPELVSRGFQTQYGIEVQIIAFLYGLLSLGFISLTLIVPRHASAARQRYGIYVWTCVFITLFSVLVSLFKIKNGGYPFRLLL